MSIIGQKTFYGLTWTAFSQVCRISTQFLGVLILSRLLPPSDFGLIAMAMVFIGFASIFSDFGTTAAIIQKTSPSAELLDSVFWFNIVLGLLLFMVTGLLSPFIALGFDEPRLKIVLWGLMLAFPITSIRTVHQAIMEKESNFRLLSIIESISSFIGLAGAVCSAWAGWGVLSLVIQTLLSATFVTVGLWITAQWRPRFRWDMAEFRGVIVFSSNLVGFNVFNYFIRNVDNLLVGKFLGATDIGYYNMAYRLVLWPIQNISGIFGRALFPVFSTLQADPVRFRDVYIRINATIILITAPLMLGFFVLREPFISVVLGERWKPVTDILFWLIPVGIFQTIGTTVGTIYLATGRTDMMFKWGIGSGLFLIPAYTIGLKWGITGVAAAYAVASSLLFYHSLAFPFSLIGLKVKTFLYALIPSLATSAIMALLIYLLLLIWPISKSYQLLHFTALVAVGVITYYVCSLFTQSIILREIRSFINKGFFKKVSGNKKKIEKGMTKIKTVHAFPTWLPLTQTWMYFQVKHLPDYIESHIACERTENLEQFYLKNIHCFNDSVSGIQYYFKKALRHYGLSRDIGWVGQIGRKTAASIVHSHFGDVGWTYLKEIKKIGAKHIVTFYGRDVSFIPKNDRRWIERYKELFDKADLFLCEGRHMASEIIKLGCPDSKVIVHHLGVEVDNIKYTERVWDPSTVLKILIAARFTEKKGIPFALEAISSIAKKIHVEVTIIGDAGSDEKSVHEKKQIFDTIYRNGLEKHVNLLGYQTHERFFEEAYKNHIFIQPSITARDGDTEGGAPISIIEMMATGMPVLSTFHCDIPDIVIHGQTGLLSYERDVNGLRSNIEWIINNYNKWPDIATKARKHVESEFDAVVQGKRLADTYETIFKN